MLLQCLISEFRIKPSCKQAQLEEGAQPKGRAMGYGREGLVKGLASVDKLCSSAAPIDKAACVYSEPKSELDGQAVTWCCQ